MSRECDICSKTSQKGKKVTLIWGVKYRTIRHRQPNLRDTSLMVDGVKRKVKVCAKCLKSVKSDRFSNVKPLTFTPAEAVSTSEANSVKTKTSSKTGTKSNPKSNS